MFMKFGSKVCLQRTLIESWVFIQENTQMPTTATYLGKKGLKSLKVERNTKHMVKWNERHWKPCIDPKLSHRPHPSFIKFASIANRCWFPWHLKQPQPKKSITKGKISSRSSFGKIFLFSIFCFCPTQQ